MEHDIEDVGMSTSDGQVRVVSHRIADELREAILEGRLAPGERVRQGELADRHQASRLPVREALRMLESDGLVKLVSNKGAWVSELDMAECIELYKIRERLEPLLISESINGTTPEQLEKMDELASAMELVADTDIEEFLRLDREFHLLTYQGASSTSLYAMIERLWNTTQHYRRAYTRTIGEDRRWVLYYEHRLIVDAIRTKNVQEAENIIENHVRKTRMALAGHPEIFDH